MKILVTGTAGFIGFHLVESLVKDASLQVVGLDNINDYYATQLKYDRLAESGIYKQDISPDKLIQSSKYKNYRFIQSDIATYDSLKSLFDREQFDIVVHLAAQAGVRYSLENPHSYVQSNLVGFVNVLECCRYAKIKHLVYASSSSVYGMNGKTPFSEDDRVDNPVSLYAATKRSDELLAYTYSHLYQLPTTGLRFFTVYGPWGRPDMAPMIFSKAIFEGQPIKLFNEGNMERDFTFVDDIVGGIKAVMDKIPTDSENQAFYRLLNIGNSSPNRLLDFVEILENLIGKKAVLELYPMQPGDVKITYADVSAIQQLTGYKPDTTLKEGLSKFIEWYKSYYHTNEN